VRSDMIM